MNHPAQPAPEGALQPLWERALSDLEGIALQDYETMASGKKTLTAIRHLRFVLETLAQPDAALRALRARCERLEGALRRCATAADTFRAQHWPRICALIAEDNKCAMADIAYPVCLSSIGQLAGAALAQPEDGK